MGGTEVKEGSWCCSTCSPGYCGEGMTCMSVQNPKSAMQSGKCTKLSGDVSESDDASESGDGSGSGDEGTEVKEGSWCCSTCSPGYCGEGMMCISVQNPKSAMQSGKCTKLSGDGSESDDASGSGDCADKHAVCPGWVTAGNSCDTATV